MGQLVYVAITSLGGYIADRTGNFDWSMPDELVHQFVNDLTRPIGTYLYGRRLYEVMTAWQDMDVVGEPAAISDFADLWRRAQKIVYSTTLARPATPNTRIEAEFDPAAVRALKADAPADLSIGGAELAGQALAVGLVDEIHQLISPVVVGGGTPFLASANLVELTLLGSRTFSNGVVYLRYRVGR